MQKKFHLRVDSGLFKGLANQNMLFHQCVCELIDNSIASKSDKPFRVDIIFTKKDNNTWNLFIVDNSNGMTNAKLQDAMQPGLLPTSDNRLNEHGFGLKHSLATLTKGTGQWKIWSKDSSNKKISSVASPFGHEMSIEDDDSFPELPYTVPEISTIVKAEVTIKYLQSVQGRGKPTEDLSKLRLWLMEYLGITYRGFLSQDPANNHEVDGTIFVSIDKDIQKVIPIEIPMEGNQNHEFIIELGGKNYTIKYIEGLIDSNKRDAYFNNQGLKCHYKQNLETQGIDIRLGKRVIATKLLLDIFGVVPHNSLNDFVAELIIPELPKAVLKTVNNKTNIDFDDDDWMKIFTKLKTEHPIRSNPRFELEKELREQWITILTSAEPRDKILKDKSVWASGVEIDVFREKFDTKEITIYELKTGAAKPLDIYQLKMYWDGLVIQKEYPHIAILMCESFNDRIQDMVNKVNLMTPQEGAKPYNFQLKTLIDCGLINTPKKKGRKG